MSLLSISIMVGICIVPMVWIMIINKRTKKSEAAFHQHLVDYASQYTSALSLHDTIYNNLTIGLSETNHHIFFLKRKKDENHLMHVNLNEIDRCQVDKTTRSSIDGNYSSTDKVALVFIPRDKSKMPVTFEFYNLEYDSLTMNGEMQLASKWHTLVSNRLMELRR